MVTAYSYPSAVHVDAADIDVLLVGDSVGMVELGHDTTLPVTVDQVREERRGEAKAEQGRPERSGADRSRAGRGGAAQSDSTQLDSMPSGSTQ